MGLAQLISSPKGPQFGAVQISGSISETHGFTAQVSKSPIESGSEIADHRRIGNTTISIDGVVTSHKNSLIEEATEIDVESASDRYNRLLDLFNDSEVFQLVTGLDIYDDCVFTSIVVNRDKTTGGVDTIHFKADVEQLRFATSDSILVPAEIAKKATADVGTKPTTPAPAVDAAKGSSLGYKAVDAVVGSPTKFFDKLGTLANDGQSL